MSEPAQPQKAITLTEIDGRIAELEEQRNGALARCARLAGEKAQAIDILLQAQAEIERLNGIINDRDSPAAATAEPNDPPLALAGAATAH